MALETLKGLTEIGGYKVIELDEAKELPEFKNPDGGFNWAKYYAFRKDYPIGITHSQNMVSFKIQNGPIKEVGQNGCQLDTLIHAAMIMIDKLNEKFSCNENIGASGHLHAALRCLDERKKKREARGVEGFSKE